MYLTQLAFFFSIGANIFCFLLGGSSKVVPPSARKSFVWRDLAGVEGILRITNGWWGGDNSVIVGDGAALDGMVSVTGNLILVMWWEFDISVLQYSFWIEWTWGPGWSRGLTGTHDFRGKLKSEGPGRCRDQTVYHQCSPSSQYARGHREPIFSRGSEGEMWALKDRISTATLISGSKPFMIPRHWWGTQNLGSNVGQGATDVLAIHAKGVNEGWILSGN